MNEEKSYRSVFDLFLADLAEVLEDKHSGEKTDDQQDNEIGISHAKA